MGIEIFMVFERHLVTSLPKDGVDQRFFRVVELRSCPVLGLCGRFSVDGIAGAFENYVHIVDGLRSVGIRSGLA